MAAALVERFHPRVTGHRRQLLLPPPHDLLKLRARALLSERERERGEKKRGDQQNRDR